jgi:hypothetical protein
LFHKMPLSSTGYLASEWSDYLRNEGDNSVDLVLLQRIHSMISHLSCDGSVDSSKASSPFFVFQLTASFLFLKVIQQLLRSPSSSSIPFHLSFNNVLQKELRTQDMTN